MAAYLENKKGNLEQLKNYLSANQLGFQIVYPENPAYENYTNPERGEKSVPSLIFIPDKIEHVQAILKLLNEYKFATVIFAGNTGLVSAQRAEGEAVIDMNLLDNIISLTLKNSEVFHFSKPNESPLKKAYIWRDELVAWKNSKGFSNKDFFDAEIECEAGASFGTLNYILAPHEIEVPVDTGAIWVGGGMSAGAAVANASHGTYGMLHGKASDLVVEVEAINGDGSPRTDKGVAGVKPVVLDGEVALNSARPQYGDSAIGTQGVFAIITKIKFVTKRLPKSRHYFLVQLDDINIVNKLRKMLRMNFTNKVLQFEIMNQFSLELVRKFEPENYINPFYDDAGKPMDGKAPISSKYVLMFQIIAFEDEDFYSYGAYDLLTLEAKISENKIAYAGGNGDDPEGFIRLRHSISSASNKYAASLGGSVEHRITPDVSVPVAEIEKFTQEVLKSVEDNNCEIALFGHTGIGSFHVHIFNIKDKKPETKEQLTGMIYQITTKHNGSCWSEHGVGTANAAMFKKYTPQKYIDEWVAYKKKYDPNNILSPRVLL